MGVMGLAVHTPLGLQAGHHVVPSAHHVARQSADAVVTHTNVVHMRVGDTGTHAANATCLAATLIVLETARWGEIQAGVGAGLAKCVSRFSISGSFRVQTSMGKLTG